MVNTQKQSSCLKIKKQTDDVVQPDRLKAMWLASLVLVYRWSGVMRLAGNTDSD